MSTTKKMVQDWFEVWEDTPGVFVIAEPKHVQEVRSYLVIGSVRAVLIDSGMGVGDIKALVEELTALPVTLINSHAHWDHIGGNWQFDDIWIHQAEAHDLERYRPASELKKWFSEDQLRGKLPAGVDAEKTDIKASHATTVLSGGETVDLGGRTLEIVHSPGHSPGGIVFLDRENELMFSTDVVYLGALYAFLPATNMADYLGTLTTLSSLAPGFKLAYPSHGETPIGPSIIVEMRNAMESIIAGRQPDSSCGQQASHVFERFSVLVPASYRGGEG